MIRGFRCRNTERLFSRIRVPRFAAIAAPGLIHVRLGRNTLPGARIHLQSIRTEGQEDSFYCLIRTAGAKAHLPVGLTHNPGTVTFTGCASTPDTSIRSSNPTRPLRDRGTNKFI